MGDAHDGHPFVVHLPQQVHHLLRGLAVEGAGRFVGEDYLRPVDEGACDGYPLLLAAGHLVGHVCAPLPDAQFVEQFECDGVAFAPRDSLVVEGQRHVLHGILVVDEIERLEDEAYHAVPRSGGLRFVESPDEPAVEVVFAFVVVVEDAHDVQQSRFARTGRPHDGDEFAFLYFEVDAFEHMQGGACVVGFVYVLEEEHLLRLYVAGISVFPDGVRRPVPGGFSNIDA